MDKYKVANESKRGILIVVSGFSGSGKGTIMKQLTRKYGQQYALSISATTRMKRPGEEHGKEYFFVSAKEFESMIEEGKLIEYARYVNHYYGTPKQYVDEQLSLGKDVILEIEVQGARKVKEAFPDALRLFVMPPSAKELMKRLVGRGTEDEASIRLRLERAAEESLGMEHYDYLIINDDLEKCVEEVHAIIQSEHYRISRNKEMVGEIIQELNSFANNENISNSNINPIGIGKGE